MEPLPRLPVSRVRFESPQGLVNTVIVSIDGSRISDWPGRKSGSQASPCPGARQRKTGRREIREQIEGTRPLTVDPVGIWC